MRRAFDIHNWDRRYKLALAGLPKKPLTELNRKLILKFLEDCQASNIGLPRRLKYVYLLSNLAQRLAKDFDDADTADIKRLVAKINDDQSMAAWTKSDLRIALKRFYGWLRGSPRGQNAPETAWIRDHSVKNRILPEELLTEDYIRSLLLACENSRDRAFIMALYEAGSRIGELLSLRRKHVSFDQYGAVLLLSSKTGDRRVRVPSSTSLLSQWWIDHPDKRPEAPFWVNIADQSRGKPLDYASARMLLVRSARRAKLKKGVNPHAFRHARASFLANAFTERQLEQYLGWTVGSRMPQTYVHLSGRDLDQAVLALNGVSTAETTKPKSQLRPRTCIRCNHQNDPISKFCSRCAMPLEMKAALEIEEKRRTAEEFMNHLLNDSDVQEFLLAKLKALISQPSASSN